MNKEYNWPPLESDPDVLNAYLKALGVSIDFLFEEVVSYDQMFSVNSQILSVLCLYQCDKSKGQTKVIKSEVVSSEECKFFIRQVEGLDKACGLIAILNSLGNIEEIKFEELSIIDTFFKETKNLKKDAQMIGEYLLNFKQFQQLHIQYSRLGQSSIDSYKSEKKSNHFVAFLNIDGNLLEFNGGIHGPQIIKKDTSKTNLLQDVLEEIDFRLKNCLITDRLNLICLIRIIK